MQSPETIICASQPGTAIFALTHRPDPRIDFLIREETSFIKQLATSKIALRARLLHKNNVALLLIMFQIGTNTPHIFTTFWDYHMEVGSGKITFELMSNQEDIAFHLYGDSKKIEQSILMGNSLRSLFKASINRIENLPSWSAEQFEREKKELLRTYPTAADLWEAIYEPKHS